MRPQEIILVDFNLTRAVEPSIVVREPILEIIENSKTVPPKQESKYNLLHNDKMRTTISKKSEAVDRTVSWERNKQVPTLSFSNHGFRARVVSQNQINP